MSEQARLERAWVANADAWSDAVRNDSIESRRLVTNRSVLAAILALSGTRILDVGCGEGWLSAQLTGHGRSVTGFDGSARLIELAAQDGGAHFMHLSYDEFVHRPDVVGTAYDIVICNYSLFTETLEPLFTTLRGRTVPGGHLIVQTIHPMIESGAYEDGWREERFESFDGQWQPMPWYFRTVGSWIDVLVESGWRLDKIYEPIHPVTLQPVSLIFTASIP